MKASLTALAIAMLCWLPGAHADRLIIAAASDLQFAMEDILDRFRAHHPDDVIDIVYGSSGKFSTQIAQGAPYDLYFSADIAYPRQLANAGHAASEVTPYAVGRIVLWRSSRNGSEMRLEDLTAQGIRRVAIANPRHAPYGARAKEALKAAGVWKKVENKLILGSNISQAAQFVETGHAEAGILALSLALSPRLSAAGSYWLIPDSMHKPLEQGYIVTRHGGNKDLAWQLSDFMSTNEARSIMTRYGFRN